MLADALGFFLLLALARSPRTPRALGDVAYRLALPSAVVSTFSQLHYLLPTARAASFDAQIYAFDRRVFGFEPAEAWDRFVTPAITEWFFVVPGPDDLEGRLEDVLSAIYAAYGTGWDDLGGEGAGLTEEAIFLGRLVVSLLPDEPEAHGLLALMLYCESRRAARRDARGELIPLSEQDPSLWSRDPIVEAEGRLTRAARHAKFGRFQCEAAIQSVHAQRAVTGVVQHGALVTLYDLLLTHAPTLGVAVARAAALCEAGRATEALDALDRLASAEERGLEAYQPYWVTRSRVTERLGRPDEARRTLERGIGLTEDPAVRAYLLRKLTHMPP